MRIKKFNNLWAMGLLLFGIILVACYIMKIFFPDFIVGVAEIPSIVSFGNYVDSHKWAYYITNGVLSFVTLFFYTCACCRIKTLRIVEVFILIGLIIISHLIEEFAVQHLVGYNFILYLLLPLIVEFIRKTNRSEIFYSTCICFVITTIAQSISLSIRNIPLYISFTNTATYFVLLIDLYIWTILLYLYYNYKGEVNNG